MNLRRTSERNTSASVSHPLKHKAFKISGVTHVSLLTPLPRPLSAGAPEDLGRAAGDLFGV